MAKLLLIPFAVVALLLFLQLLADTAESVRVGKSDPRNWSARLGSWLGAAFPHFRPTFLLPTFYFATSGLTLLPQWFETSAIFILIAIALLGLVIPARSVDRKPQLARKILWVIGLAVCGLGARLSASWDNLRWFIIPAGAVSGIALVIAGSDWMAAVSRRQMVQERHR